MKAQLERRSIKEVLKIETRDDSGVNIIQGYSALFGVEAEIYGLFTEDIQRGAFKRAVKEGDDCRCLFNHDANYLLGRTSAGTLRLQEDDKGLWMECDMPDTQVGRDVLYSIKRGDVTGQSFAAVVTKEEWTMSKDPKKLSHRTIVEVELYDTSPCTYPAYSETSVSTRSIAETAYERAFKEWEATERSQEVITVTISPEPFLLKVRSLRAALL